MPNNIDGDAINEAIQMGHIAVYNKHWPADYVAEETIEAIIEYERELEATDGRED